jgi:multidrug resistance efflux pump
MKLEVVMKKTIISLLLVSVLLVGCGPAESTALQASGQIEATEIAVAPEMSGRVVEVLVSEGDSVSAGDPLLTLDDSLLQAQKRTLEAGLDSANANVQSAQEALDTAQLQYEQTLSSALEAEKATRVDIWTETKPSKFDQPTWYFNREERLKAAQDELAAAKADLETELAKLESVNNQVASTALLEAEAKLSGARITFQNAEEVYDRTSGATSDLRDAADTARDDAELDLEDAQDDYDDALTSDDADDLLEARARVYVAQERYDSALDTLRAFQTGEDSPEVAMASQVVEQAKANLEAAQTSVKQVQAQLSEIETQMGKLVVHAPQDGVVLVRSIQVGEVIQGGMTAMSIAKLETLKVTVYISEERYGEVKLGNSASLSVDSFPGESFSATVTRIADQAEYTPRNVQTKEERQTTVYAVELSVENPDGKLKPGMPVDLTFGQ